MYCIYIYIYIYIYVYIYNYTKSICEFQAFHSMDTMLHERGSGQRVYVLLFPRGLITPCAKNKEVDQLCSTSY
jgi:hypothetical protein